MKNSNITPVKWHIFFAVFCFVQSVISQSSFSFFWNFVQNCHRGGLLEKMKLPPEGIELATPAITGFKSDPFPIVLTRHVLNRNP